MQLYPDLAPQRRTQKALPWREIIDDLARGFSMLIIVSAVIVLASGAIPS